MAFSKSWLNVVGDQGNGLLSQHFSIRVVPRNRFWLARFGWKIPGLKSEKEIETRVGGLAHV